ncbi:TonB-dependent receptor [Fulvimonas soli]|jgi:outer membrane cobalamin receptor|uniref:Outer membrane receptor protein involved in Fe transport n=1 Tax=Fulvimonas soli TaxID=155197 RepID=A0A316INC4_9GAMM|nr:TonB-dependent receptor [Fulvimonas soli]PWK88600.1 outer membrane receptor protein involved in Fe transport [Fulvimonas soli]TNY27304.1 TonB-dependent receptor [Fulvimonas soli]
MKTKQLTRLTLSAAIAAVLFCGAAMAQDAAPAQDAQKTQPPPAKRTPAQQQQANPESAKNLEQVVVTGNTATGGLKKIDTSYSVVTATSEQIKMANPKSTADLLKISPGLWPESTGGQTGANIEIAGFPGGGDAPFNTVQLMGSPLYGMPSLSFFEQTSMFRLDDTIDRVEIVQGGPSVVFADGQIGATENYMLKTGTDKPSGSIGVTYGNENLRRVDGFLGFPIANNWYGSIGGFYRDSDGVRDPQFAADKGGQFTATLSHDSDNGTMTLYGRYLNDRNQFITPIPLIQSGTDDFHPYPGFDPLKDTYYGKEIQHVHLAGYPGGGTDANLANGRGAKMGFFGGNFDYDLGDGWNLSDKFLFDGGDMNTNALFSGTNPASLYDELYTVPKDQGGFELPAGSATATYVKGGGAVDPNQSVIHQGWWFIHKHLKNVNNDFRLSKEIFDGNTLTAGIYLAHYTEDDKWALGNQMLMTNTPHARPIQVSYVDGGQTYYLTDGQGLLDNGTFNITNHGTATNKAFYLSDIWRVGPWLFDLSGRIENQNASTTVCNTSNVDTDGNPYTLYNNAVSTCNGTFTHTKYDKSHPSWTFGVNYELADNMSVYVRVNKGAHFPDFDNGIRGQPSDNTAPMQRVFNFEGGFKYQSQYLYADISAYHKQFDGLLFQPTDGAGTPVGSPRLYGSDSKGINLTGAVTPTENLRIQVVANYLDGHYSHNESCLPYTNLVTGETACASINGVRLQRQPRFRYMLTPSYKFPFSWGDILAFVTYTHVGPHTQDQSGLQQLGTYNTWDFGVVADVLDSWELRLQGTNMTNELGLTESNSRIFGTAAGTNGVILARPLEGREVNFQVKYKF